MIRMWKDIFTWKKFKFTHEDPLVFAQCQWQDDPEPNMYYCIYRWLVAAFFLISLILSIIDPLNIDQSAEARAKWLIYLTNWGFTLCTIQALLSAFIQTGCVLKARNHDRVFGVSVQWSGNRALKLYSLYWVNNSIATNVAFGITIVYWSVIYDGDKVNLDGMNAVVHIMNSVVMFLDLCVVAHPTRIFHFYPSIVFGICYTIFTIIYYVAGGTNKEGFVYIYAIVDWRKPGRTILICVSVTFFLLILHIFVFGIYKLRRYIHGKVRNIEDGQPRANSTKMRKTFGLSDVVEV